MLQSSFEALTRQAQLEVMAWNLAHANSKAGVFGDDEHRRKALLRFAHPDLNADNADLANQVTAQLNVLWEVPASSASPVIDGLQVFEKLGSGDYCDVWYAEKDGKPYTLKIARETPDNDLLLHEVKIIDKLMGSPILSSKAPPPQKGFIGKLEGRQYAVYPASLASPRQLVTLTDIAHYADNQIEPKAIGWIWKRILGGLEQAHYIGIIHGNLNPDNILVDIQNHGVRLIGWSVASVNQDPIQGMSETWEGLYPPDFASGSRPMPYHDTYMAAKSILWASKNLPPPMKGHFRLCTAEIPNQRWFDYQLLSEDWDNILFGILGWKQEFVPLVYEDRQIDWSWFDGK